ncbi:hypothetical protein OESDEN_11104 [Oesophagostomum dentatum]|uniref:Uncharacterized protein n=1 Tax=Oesophagostomum dentatum TaxID=61180 RepID=A0A0B1SYU3_OESDE|nr:hypothetical protein OESDEN_11104 [Oesophagostomum dentatum]
MLAGAAKARSVKAEQLSLAVIALVCAMLLIVVAFLHYREKKEDRVERQQQSHRFHFDAM